ncbi:MAG: hypothetical protein GX030_01470 [Firmicutes bacterium]|nr:hypothetical protein [Bacillota bacterium]
MKLVLHTLFFFHLYVGIGALFGGAAAMINPYDPLGVSAESLVNSPFSSFLIPGIILFGLLGVGNIAGALALRRRSKYTGYVSATLGGALVIWIIVQCLMLDTVVFLHVLYGIIGLIQAILATRLLVAQRMFPFNLLVDFLNHRRDNTRDA